MSVALTAHASPSPLQDVLQCLNADPQRLKDNWCVPPPQGELMTMLARIHGSKRILEVGTSIGYSGLCFLQALTETDGHLTTIDASAERQGIAQQHFTQAGCAHRVTLLTGDALPLMQELVRQASHEPSQRFDMVFLDARKSEYIDYWRLSHGVLRPGGLLLADNTLSHRKQMQDFIDAIGQDAGWQVAEIPTDHGLLVGRKNH